MELPPGTQLPPGAELPEGTVLPPGTRFTRKEIFRYYLKKLHLVSDKPRTDPVTAADKHSTIPAQPGESAAPGAAPSGSLRGRFVFVQKYDTDKFESGLMLEYVSLLQALRSKPVRILEVGIGQGGSGRFLWDYFRHPDSRFVGVDINMLPNLQVDPRAQILHCDQNDSDKLASICKKFGPFDVVIDDASHFAKETQNTFEVCHGHVVRGGYYIIEDWAAHYMGGPYTGMNLVVTNIMNNLFGFGFDEMKIVRLYSGSTAIFRKG